MFGSIGMPELIIILVIALIIFGPRKLPGARQVARPEPQRVQARLDRPAEHPRAGNQARGAEGDGRPRTRSSRPLHAAVDRPLRRAADAPCRGADDRAVPRSAASTADGTRSVSRHRPLRPIPTTTSARTRRNSRGAGARRDRPSPANRGGRGTARRADDVSRAPRRTAQAHHARRRRAARRLPRSRSRSSIASGTFVYARLTADDSRRQVDLHRAGRGVLPLHQDGGDRRPADLVAVRDVAGVAVHRARACTPTKRSWRFRSSSSPRRSSSAARRSRTTSCSRCAWQFFASFSNEFVVVHAARRAGLRRSTSSCCWRMGADLPAADADVRAGALRHRHGALPDARNFKYAVLIIFIVVGDRHARRQHGAAGHHGRVDDRALRHQHRRRVALRQETRRDDDANS